MTRFLAPILALALCGALVLSGQAFAQEPPGPDAETPAGTDQTATPAPGPELGLSDPELIGPPLAPQAASNVIGGIDYAAWHRAAQRTAAISENGGGSAFALERLRGDLVIWRDRFIVAQESNGARISTVNAQIQALGATATDGEDARVTERRSELAAELARLRAPVQLAQEAYAQANGLIAEIDSLLRARQTEAMTTRGESPLWPGHWPLIASDLTGLVSSLWKEATVTFTSAARRSVLIGALSEVLVALLIGAVLLARGRRWIDRLSGLIARRLKRGMRVVEFLLSLGTIVVPFLGLSFVVGAVMLSGLPGFRLSQVIQQIPAAGIFVITSRWLADMLFGDGSRAPLARDFDQDERLRARRLINHMGWFMGLNVMVLAVLGAGDIDPVARTAAILPAQCLVSWVFYRLGRLLLSGARRDAQDEGEAVDFRRGLVSLIARATMAVALLGPALTAAGFTIAGEALTQPFAMTLSLIGLVMILQTLAFDLYELIMGGEDRSRDALLPVIVGMILSLLALPVLVLFWGARVEDLNELWTRFREGFSMGETRISPTDFLGLLVIFGIGYMATRLLQGVLRTTILPKTKLDAGGRTALISGVGYIGIFLSVVIAVTSMGIDLSSLAIVAGALSVGIGFGMQNIVSNFISGIILLIERPISQGDWIEVGGMQGYVRGISVRSTRIETFDRSNVIVPNADLISGRVTNYTRGSSVGRVIVPVSVMFGSDTDKVLRILREIAEGHPMVLLNPPPGVVLVNFGADTLNFEIRAIVRDVNFGGSIKSEMNIEIANRFWAEGVEFAGGARGNGAAGRTALSPKAGPGEMRVTLIRPEDAAPKAPPPLEAGEAHETESPKTEASETDALREPEPGAKDFSRS